MQLLSTAWRTALTIVFVALVHGCVTVDGTLEANGSGKFTMTYRCPRNTTEATERGHWTSAHVHVELLQVQTDRATVSATFDDVTKLSSADGFSAVTVTRSRDGDDEQLRFVIKNANASPDVRDEGRTGPRIALTLPGAVAEANRKGEISGNRVVWQLSFVEYMRSPQTELTVRYRAAATSTTTAAAH